MRNFKLYMLLFTGVLLMQSCLHEEDDIFSMSSAQRLNESQKKYSEILTSASNGWVLEYVAGDTDATRRGAFNYLLKFENDQVTAAVDSVALMDIDPSASDVYKTITSLYRFDQDMGVTISFDSYNSFLHYYHEQHGSYITYNGDYEFMVIEASKDLVVLRGKKYENVMQMRRLPDNVTWKEYLQQVNKTFAQVSEYPEFTINVGGQALKGSVLSNQQFSYANDSETSAANPLFTPTGIKFVKPIYSDDKKKAVNFAWNYETGTLTCTDEGATDVSIVMTTPAGYSRYVDFLGTYTFNYLTNGNVAQTRTVVVTEKVKGISYSVENFVINMPAVEMKYNKPEGAIGVSAQILANSPAGYPVGLYAASLTWSFYPTALGEGMGRFLGKRSADPENPKITFTRDPYGTLSSATIGFLTIEIRNGSNYLWNATSSYQQMYWVKQ